MPTIHDVAKFTGLSVGTVSNVLNGLPSVSKENREKVNKAIEQLGYRRNQVASQLRSNVSHTIGVVLPDISNPFYPEIARGVEDVAQKEGYNIFLCNKDRSISKEKAAIEALIGKQVDGILLFRPHISQKAVQELHKHCPLVLFDVNPESVACDTVNVDDYKGMCEALEETIRLGHRRIAFLAGPSGSVSRERRLAAYNDVLAENKIPIPRGYLQHGDYTAASGRIAVKKWMTLPKPPTVIVSSNDMMALGIMSGLKEMGYRVPEDVSVVGYDDIDNSQWIGLTTTCHPKYEMGEMAIKMLLAQIHSRQQNKILAKQSILMYTELKIRDTLGKPKE